MDGPVNTQWPHPLPARRAGPKPTHDSKFGATAPLSGPSWALLLTEVDAIVLKLDVTDDEGGAGVALGLLDVSLLQVQQLGLRVLSLLPEPVHMAQNHHVAHYCHSGTPFLGHETWVLPDLGTSASYRCQGQD